MILCKDKALLILYLVIRNTEILPELGCWSSINTLHWVKFMVMSTFCVCILSLAR